MGTEKIIRNALLTTGAIVGAMYGFNKLVEYNATKNHLTVEENSNFYVWKHGDIFYKKKGTGSPMLLIHDLHPASSSYEWSKIINSLSKNHTVYAIDLLGCGKSEKPNINYVNYLYVQLINDFIKNVVGEAVEAVVTGDSFSAVAMACRMNPENFTKITAINPANLIEGCKAPTKASDSKRNIMRLPILGNFIYNSIANSKSMEALFKKQYYKDPSKVSKKMIDIYLESSHLSNSSGKNLFASILGRYTGINILYAVKYIDVPMTFIVTDGFDESKEYLDCKNDIEVQYIDNCGYLPQMEMPNELVKIIG